MKAWQHGAYIAVIVILGLTLFVFRNNLVADAEKRVIPTSKTYYAVDSYLSVRGSWRQVGHNDNPKSVFEYSCWRDEDFCTEAEALVTGDTLFVHNTRYQIVSWTDQQLEMTDTSPLCRDVVIRIDLVAQDATMVNKAKADNPTGCENYSYAPVKLELVDGAEVTIANMAAKN